MPTARFDRTLKAVREATTVAQTVAGGEPVAVPVVFVANDGFFVSATASTLHITNAETGSRARSLSAHAHLVTGIVAHEGNQFLVYSASMDATVRLWDVSDGSLVKTWTFCSPITHFAIDPSTSESFYLAFAPSSPDMKLAKECTVERFLLRVLDPEATPESDEKDARKQFAHAEELVFSSRFHFTALVASTTMVAAATQQKIWIKSVNVDMEPKRLHLPNKQYTTPSTITSLACHPTATIVSAGLTSGEILLYHKPFSDSSSSNISSSSVALQILHWHANPVHSLAFTHDGTTLLSGGLESVIVLWQLDTLKRRYIPRVSGGSAIRSIAASADDRLLGVVCGDASVRVLGLAELEVKTVVMGLKAAERRLLAGNALVADPRSGAVVVAGSSGCVQFYDVWGDVSMMEVEAVAQNRIVASTGDTVVGEESWAAVRLVAFERDGKRGRWMATLDERTGMTAGGKSEACLKFWCWDDINQIYTVNTRVTSPHDGSITSMHFLSLPAQDTPNKSLLLVTTSLDTRFKVWELTPAPPTARDEEPSWTQRAQGFYRDSPVYHAATSPDASILAVATGSVATLWDPATNALCAALTHPRSDEHVLKVEFAGFRQTQAAAEAHAEVPCLVALTASTCYVWNLLTGTVWWSVALGGVGSVLAVDDETGRFVVSALVVEERDASAEDSGVEVKATPAAPAGKKKKKAAAAAEATANVATPETDNTVITRIMEFDSSSPVPVFVHEAKGKVHGLLYAPSEHASPVRIRDYGARILTLTSRYEIDVVGVASRSSEKAEVSWNGDLVQVGGSANPASALFSGMFGDEAFKDPVVTVPIPANAHTFKSSTGVASEEAKKLVFMDTASHLLLPPAKLALPFFDAILKKRDTVQEQAERAAWDLGLSGPSTGSYESEVMDGDGPRVGSNLTEVTFRDMEGLEFMSDVFLRTSVLNKNSQNAPAKLLTMRKFATPTRAADTPSTNGSGKSAKPASGAAPSSSVKTQGSASSKSTTSGTPAPASKLKFVVSATTTPASTAMTQKKAAKLSAKQKSV
ncbi:hypothetical protein BC830DRAFT_1171535 [Chytriomyces sp. MP71]|nr:hypothetical protein BC830DRAFT_1171535 [Chytriomyces sp. MP71]